MLKWIYSRINKLLSSDRDYRFDYIIKNIDKLTNEKLLKIKINAIMNRKHIILSFYILKDTFTVFNRVMDEEDKTSIDIEYSCFTSDTKQVSLMSMLYSDGYLNANYKKTLKDTLILYNTTLKIMNSIQDDKTISLQTDYNCNLFRLYIISMEDVIEKLYNSLSQDVF